MADVRVLPDVKVSDATTPSQQLAVDSAGRIKVMGGVAQDSAVTDQPVQSGGRASTATPTAMSADGDSVYRWLDRSGGTIINGRDAHDAALDANTNPALLGGRASAAAPTDVSADGDAVRGWFLRNGAQSVVVTAAGALIGGDATNGLDVDVTRVQGTVTVDTEMPAAAALADAESASTSVPTVGARLMGYNGTTWDRVRTANTGRLQVDVVTGGGGTPANIIVDNNAFTDGTTSVGMVGYVFDETAGAALTENDGAAARIDSKRAQVHVIEDATTRGQRLAVNASGAASVDTELPTAAAISADAQSAPTAPSVYNFGMGFNGTTWDRIRVANTGRLQVDVITGGGTDTPTNPVNNYDTSASIAAGSTDNHDSADLGGTTKKLRKVIISASVPLKGEIQSVINGTGTTIGVIFSQAGEEGIWEPPHRNYASQAFSANAGFDGWRIIRTNLDASEAADVYSNMFYED